MSVFQGRVRPGCLSLNRFKIGSLFWLSLIGFSLLILRMDRVFASYDDINPGGSGVVSTPERDPVQVFPYMDVEMNGSIVLLINSVTITITNYSAGNEELLFTNPSGFSGSFNSGTGVLTITASSAQTFSTWKPIIRSVTYRNTSGSPFGSARTITGQLNFKLDGGAPSHTLNSFTYNPNNGHYYQYVNVSVDWNGARTAALAQTLLGENGYLLNVTSDSELSFIRTTFTVLADGAYFGANASNPAGGNNGNDTDAYYEDINNWEWADGPEAGTKTYLATSTGFRAPNEPNTNGGAAYFYPDETWDNVPKITGSKDYIVEITGSSLPDMPRTFSTTVVTYADTPGIFNEDHLTTTHVTVNATPTVSFVDVGALVQFKSATITLVDPFPSGESIGFIPTTSVTKQAGGDAFTFTLDAPTALPSSTWSDILGNITYRLDLQSPGSLTRQIHIQMNYPTTGNYIYDAVVGHFYYFHNVFQPYADHADDISISSYAGLSPYFSTIASAEEQAIVSINLTRTNIAYISGDDSTVNTVYRFSDGPDDGNLILFQPWSTDEPSDDGPLLEMYADGLWNDIPGSTSRRAIFEFGGSSGDTVHLYTVTANIFISPKFSTGFGTNL